MIFCAMKIGGADCSACFGGDELQMRFEEIWSWLLFRADRLDQVLVGLIGLGLAVALVAAVLPARLND